jgi:hypothetical protein
LKTHRMPVTQCPRCKAPVNRQTGFDQQEPVPGDLTVCSACGTMLRFHKDLALVLISGREVRALPLATRRKLLGVQAAILKTLRSVN